MFENVDLIPFIMNMAVILLPIVAGYAVRVWRQNAEAIERKIEAEIGEKWWALIENAARTLVHAAEQASGIDTNEEKKKFVLDHLYNLVVQWNIPITRGQLDAIIEGVYKEWIKDAWTPAVINQEQNDSTS